jgi:GH43 family beta-xylosidase
MILQNKLRTFIILTSVFLLLFCKKKDAPTPLPPPTTGTFVNPLKNGSDPWITKKDAFYYYTQTMGNRIELWKTTATSKLGTITSKNIFAPPVAAPNSSNVWAPELHYLNNKWYVYYTAGAGADNTQRTWVLENGNDDPTTGTWTDKGRIFAGDTDFWAIDGSVFEYKGSIYFLWSGRPDPSVQNQNIYIAKMADPWTLQTPSVMLTRPELSWEVNGGPVNEAPQILKNSNGKIYLVYSASGCWTDDYALGMLSLKDNGDPLVISDWTKNPQPVFTKNPQNNAFGPGHNAFFKSVDGTEDWIIYHSNTNSGDGCGEKRNIRMQKFSWHTDGTPNFGEPVKTGAPVKLPSGE